MSEKQEKNLKETIFTMHAEGFDIPEDEKTALIDVLNGKRTFKELYAQYLARATANV